MTEHRCIVCPQMRQGDPRTYERANVCEGCRSRLRSLLGEIAPLYERLPGEMLPGQGGGQRVSGSHEAPLPLALAPLDLSMPAHPASVQEPPCTCREPRSDCRPGRPHHDQIGHVGVASVLDAWVSDWCDVRDRGEHPPLPTVEALARWLTDRLDDACDSHPAIDEFAAEINSLVRVLRQTVGVSEVRPEHLDVPCRRCDLLDLHRLPGQDRVECGSCGDLLTEEEYRRWVGLVAADMMEMKA